MVPSKVLRICPKQHDNLCTRLFFFFIQSCVLELVQCLNRYHVRYTSVLSGSASLPVHLE
jgi:hypothetical protein